eukprot:TRINITY_DN2987_c0_g1_i15.p1 TRINITY_DN2987_c0_g1~~TRINITY_DN2987_c0_g1_i15.p1  ORF type:complete len:287 (-),score=41.43 TRINITY_DN2987_c0_g1_i15:1408-2268(-)
MQTIQSAAHAQMETECTIASMARGLESLMSEPQDGNTEYKLQLCSPSVERFQHLVTQMKWRLGEGQGEAIYEIGVEDDGTVRGIAPEQMDQSLNTLSLMAQELQAETTVLVTRNTRDGMKSCQVLVRKMVCDHNGLIDVRVAVAGNVDSGKSTLIGVLTQGHNDNGRGSARSQVFRFQHEAETGRTSAISHHILGFDVKGSVVNHRFGLRQPSWEDIAQDSVKLVTFVDLAGHERYLKTSVYGLCQQPDYVLLLVGANMGVSKMTREFMGIAISLKIPIVIVLTKV